MELFSQTEAREDAAREKAWHYERVLAEVTRLEKSLAHLRAMSFETSALERILELSRDIPDGLLTRSGRFHSGGFEIRPFVRELVSHAIEDLNGRKTKQESAIATTQKKLAETKKALEALS